MWVGTVTVSGTALPLSAISGVFRPTLPSSGVPLAMAPIQERAWSAVAKALRATSAPASAAKAVRRVSLEVTIVPLVPDVRRGEFLSLVHLSQIEFQFAIFNRVGRQHVGAHLDIA